MKTFVKINTALAITAIIIIIATIAGSIVHGATSLNFTSSPTSYVGAGQTVNATTSAYNFSVQIVSGSSSLGSLEQLTLGCTNPSNTSDYWTLVVGPLPGALLAVGEYQNAARFGQWLTNQPHLDFLGQHRGNNNTSGSFNVLELVRGSGGTIVSAAVDFVQYDEGIVSKRNDGSFRYNSSVPITVPEPGKAMMLFAGISAAVLRRRR